MDGAFATTTGKRKPENKVLPRKTLPERKGPVLPKPEMLLLQRLVQLLH
jgi:hypothetical protein